MITDLELQIKKLLSENKKIAGDIKRKIIRRQIMEISGQYVQNFGKWIWWIFFTICSYKVTSIVEDLSFYCFHSIIFLICNSTTLLLRIHSLESLWSPAFSSNLLMLIFGGSRETLGKGRNPIIGSLGKGKWERTQFFIKNVFEKDLEIFEKRILKF